MIKSDYKFIEDHKGSTIPEPMTWISNPEGYLSINHSGIMLPSGLYIVYKYYVDKAVIRKIIKAYYKS